MRLLITGGSGFIGSHLVRHFFGKYPDYKIVNLDLLTYAGNPKNLWDIEAAESKLASEGKRYVFIRGDICDHDLVTRILRAENFEAIINLAAETHVDRSIIESKSFIKTNIQGVHTLLDAVRKHKVPRFIHFSTDEVYGDRHGKDSANEETAFHPSSPYSASKAAADFLVQSYVRTFKVPAIIVRPNNNFGSHQYPEKLIPLTISNILENKKVPVHGDGMQIRSWLFVKDMCEAIDVLLHRGINGEIYNLGGYEIPNIEIIKLIAEILERDPDAHIDFVQDRPGHDRKYSVNWDRYQKHYGHSWDSKANFRDHLAQTVSWYLKNPEWWKALKKSPAFQDHYTRQIQGRWF